MAIGKRKSIGEFMPVIKFDARVGRFYVQDRVQRGSEWETEQHDVTDGFSAILDLANLEVGWIRFPKGAAPETKLVPAGQDIGDPPSENHKEGLRVLVKLTDEEIVRELLSSAVGLWIGIDELHDHYIAAAADHVGQLPVVELTDVHENKTSSGTSWTPIFKIMDWVQRPADMPEKAPPRSQPKKKTKSNSARDNSMDEEIPF